SERSELRIAIPRVEWKIVFNLLQLRAEARQLAGFLLVADGDEGFEGSLVVEPLVLVHLVGADGRLDAGVELHPGDVAVVVIVGQERLRPFLEKRLERRLARERRRLTEQSRGVRELALIFKAVGNGDQLPFRVATNRRIEPCREGLLRPR